MPETTKITARVRLLIIFRYVHKTIICKSWLKGYITSNTDRTQFAWRRLNISNWTTKIRLEYVHVVNHYKQQHIIRYFFFQNYKDTYTYMNHKENKYFHDADKTQTKPFFITIHVNLSYLLKIDSLSDDVLMTIAR